MDEEKIKTAFTSFCRTIARLRHPEDGCPWDLKQTHVSLREYMIEEAYEAATEMNSTDSTEELCDELGDVLLQVVLNAQIAEDNQAFNIGDVIRSIDEKMIRRHPHVFDPQATNKDEDSIRRNWERIKEEEKRDQEQKSYFAKAEKVQPALSRAHAIGKLASKINFDWDNVEQVLTKLESEVAELREAVSQKNISQEKIQNEMGDVFFSAAQVARHLGLDSETSAHHGNQKFLQRFSKVEESAKKTGTDITKASQQELEKLWNQSKINEK